MAFDSSETLKDMAAAYEKRGHELVELELALFGANERPIAKLKHTAIIKLRENR